MAAAPLLPDRHPTRDFFIPDIFDNLPFKDDVASMENPFFTLSTKPDHRTLAYQNGNKSVVVMPSHIGLPTIFDKDVLLYCGSQLMEQLNRGEIPPKTLRIAINDFLVATNRPDGGDAYKRFKNCLIRLTSCLVETTVKTGSKAQINGFGLLESYSYLESENVKGRILGVEITLSDWFYNSLIAKEVLTIDRDYFRLRKPIERRVYEIARKHCGRGKNWDISLQRLYEKSGALSAIKHFRSAVRQLEKHNHLPEYLISFDAERDMVTFRYRGISAKNSDDQGELFSDTPATIPTQIPPDLLDDARRVVGMGPDYYELWHEFINWKGAKKAKNLRGGFIGFCKRKAAKMVKYG